MMDSAKIPDCLQGCRLPPWESLPDFGLYMDQMIPFVNRAFPEAGPYLELTPSMINNYVKAGLMDKPSGKKYSREALAQLMMLIQLKLTTPMDLMKVLLHPEENTDTERLYQQFSAHQDQMIRLFRQHADQDPMMLALASSSLQLMLRLTQAEEKNPSSPAD